jgi:hypothetical protein
MASDILGYVLTIGVFLLPAYVIFRACQALLKWVFEAQALVVGLPFP